MFGRRVVGGDEWGVVASNTSNTEEEKKTKEKERGRACWGLRNGQQT